MVCLVLDIREAHDLLGGVVQTMMHHHIIIIILNKYLLGYVVPRILEVITVTCSVM